MIRFLLISFLTVLLSFTANSQVLYGSQIDYKQLDTFKYEVRLVVYADCRHAAFQVDSNSYFQMKGNSGTVKLSAGLISVKNISNYHDTITSCDSGNNHLGILQYTFIDTVNFNTTYSSFKNDSLILFEFLNNKTWKGTNVMCGSSDTIRKSRNFAELSLYYKAKGTQFSSDAVFLYEAGVEFYTNFSATYNNGIDSINYSIRPTYNDTGEVLRNCTTSVNGNWNWSYSVPFISYYPGWTSSTYSNPNSSPPIGLYFEPKTSLMCYTPIQPNANDNFAVEAILWEKQANGSKIAAGKVRREQFHIIQNIEYNNSPIINGPYSYQICEGNELCFNIATNDPTVTFPPPTPTPAPDSVKVHWDSSMSKNGATFTITNPTARLQTGRFCWTPPIGTNTEQPYMFSVTAKDNNGVRNLVSKRVFVITVKPVAKAKVNLDTIHCGSDVVGIARNVLLDSNFQGSPSINTQLLDSLGNALNTERLFFNSINGSVSTQLSDTLLGDTSGIFILRTMVNSTPHNCPITLYDTISIQLNTPEDVSVAKVKVICNQVEDTLKIPGNWTSIQWNTGETTPFKVVRTTGDYVAYAQDSCGNSFRFFTKVFMHYTIKSPLIDSILCNGEPMNYLYNDTNAYSILWSNGKRTNAFTTYNQGLIWVQIENRCDYLVDSITVLKFNTPKTLLPKDTFLCSGDSLLLMSLSADKSASKLWNTGEITDSIQVKLAGVYWLRQENYCGTSTDTIYIRGSAKPAVQLPKDTFLCFGDSLTLRSENVDTIATKEWNDGSLNDSIVVQQNGIYWLKLTNECGVSTDTINIAEKQMPKVNLGSDIFADLPFSIELKADSADTYLWSTGSNSSAIQVTDTGCYWVQVGNVCGTASDTICIADTLSGTGLAILQKLGVEVYPNPASDILIIQSASLPIQSAALVDLAGSQIVKYDVNQPNFHLQVNEIASGTYFLKLSLEDKIYWSKVLIDRR